MQSLLTTVKMNQLKKRQGERLTTMNTGVMNIMAADAVGYVDETRVIPTPVKQMSNEEGLDKKFEDRIII